VGQAKAWPYDLFALEVHAGLHLICHCERDVAIPCCARHCEQSEAISLVAYSWRLLRHFVPRNDNEKTLVLSLRRERIKVRGIL